MKKILLVFVLCFCILFNYTISSAKMDYLRMVSSDNNKKLNLTMNTADLTVVVKYCNRSYKVSNTNSNVKIKLKNKLEHGKFINITVKKKKSKQFYRYRLVDSFGGIKFMRVG